jgi:hypothetical protein
MVFISKVGKLVSMIDKLYDFLGEQPLLNKILRTHHVDIHQSLAEIKTAIEELKPEPLDKTIWQLEHQRQIDKIRPDISRALKATRNLDQDPDPQLVEDYMHFLIWYSLDKVEFIEQGVKNFEEYTSRTNQLHQKSLQE